MTESASPHQVPQAYVTKAELAESQLRARIQSGQFAAGTRLQVRELQAELGMSPTPIREALKLLESDGLVDYEPNKGVVVSSFAEHSLTDVLDLRLALEPLATGLAAERRTADDLTHILQVHERMVRAGSTGTPAVTELARLNKALHSAIFHAAHSPPLENFVQRLWRNFPIRLTWSRPGGSAASIDEHQKIIDLIKNGDRAGATESMRFHITYHLTEDRLEPSNSDQRADPGASRGENGACAWVR
jgi:DNA-binding GntR family transcriptional regulator